MGDDGDPEHSPTGKSDHTSPRGPARGVERTWFTAVQQRGASPPLLHCGDNPAIPGWGVWVAPVCRQGPNIARTMRTV